VAQVRLVDYHVLIIDGRDGDLERRA